jgi:type III secretion protein L
MNKPARFIRVADLSAYRVASADPGDPVMTASDAAQWLGAAEMLDMARQESERIRSEAIEAFEAERQKGFAQGLSEAKQEMAERMVESAALAVEYLGAIEERMVVLVMQAVRRIIADYDESDRVMAVVKSGLSVMRNQKQLTLRLPPDRIDIVRNRATELLEQFPGVGVVDFAPDSRLKGDAAILESDIGVVESSIESQLSALEAGFRKVFGSRV